MIKINFIFIIFIIINEYYYIVFFNYLNILKHLINKYMYIY